MILELLWFRNRLGFWAVRVRGEVITSTRTSLAMAQKDLAFKVAIAAGEWVDQ